ncbi:hypothetical protein LPJ77_002466 [Coemansia sp. RSA 2523]|nr:hypothetical protein LPJ58_001492 [Coemansia sp. RSA 1591]KAJ1777973.1 hypothetical protein LPJ54_002031 [Coemansia sp. RSA 1824]KAJ1791302.1 hypothetical protein LPJ67_001896 [Coemansia sp. RSA 1938]KAJ1808262.1 hypothetical protein LPJ77_002466 [Coemansia sp. RSA 2523]KAJ2140829.1 hypothetical protein J3F82_005602 [Coemansia sp. RSA 637]KAJ2187307.1 hypothetical protein EV181_002830 [Coemansia sp. RSA 532]KAJ2201585.1 hypothetical protein IW144_000195 [Coemansia sp. RSA 522]KAJ2294049.1
MHANTRAATSSNSHTVPAGMSKDDAIRRTSRILRQLYHREQQWFESRTPEQMQLLTQQGQLSLSEQLHYGELAFVLLHLKPCAIIDFAGDRSQLNSYIAAAINPTLRDLNAVGAANAGVSRNCDGATTACYPRSFRLVCAQISGQLASPEVSSWTGAFVVYDEEWRESAEWTRTNLLNPSNTLITEDELARGLDYPGSIPKSLDEMRSIVPVSYLGRMK